MPIISWQDGFSVGVTKFDGQHKRLIDLINELHDAMSKGKGKDVLGKIISSLIDYTKSHFAEEERVMQAQAYPGLSHHRMEHERLVKSVVDFQTKFNAGAGIIPMEVMNFLRDWLKTHIMQVDKQYTAHLNSKGIV